MHPAGGGLVKPGMAVFFLGQFLKSTATVLHHENALGVSEVGRIVFGLGRHGFGAGSRLWARTDITPPPENDRLRRKIQPHLVKIGPLGLDLMANDFRLFCIQVDSIVAAGSLTRGEITAGDFPLEAFPVESGFLDAVAQSSCGARKCTDGVIWRRHGAMRGVGREFVDPAPSGRLDGRRFLWSFAGSHEGIERR